MSGQVNEWKRVHRQQIFGDTSGTWVKSRLLGGPGGLDPPEADLFWLRTGWRYRKGVSHDEGCGEAD